MENYLRSALDPELDPTVESVVWDPAGLDKLQSSKADLVIAVAVPPSPKALTLFQRLRENPIRPPILAVLPREVDSGTFGVVSDSADDFMMWPAEKEELRFRLQRILRQGSTNSQIQMAYDHLSQTLAMGQLIGNHASFTRVIRQIPLFAGSSLPVLITGPTGTGKELCARAIHHLSARRRFPFVAADCGAIPEHLIENELFGHVRGAFTDAHTDQKGLAALAEGGTLFLDEIDALSLCAQAKLLRFLQERVYRPLGADRFINADIHIRAATNRDIESLVKQKRFREDLYFRLNALRLQLPSLRQSDIGVLARHFLNTRSTSSGPTRKMLSVAALNKLQAYDWPGNVRELLNVLERASLFSEGQYILPDHILLPSDPFESAPRADFNHERSRAIEAFERRYVQELLVQHNGNVTRAAIAAGKERRAFGRLKKKYRIST